MDSSFPAAEQNCVICGALVPGTVEDLERHVNVHLDENENQESVELAVVLAAIDSSSEPNLPDNCAGPASHLQTSSVPPWISPELQHINGGDASASRNSTGADGARAMSQSFPLELLQTLRGGLADSAENVLENMGSRLVKCYSVLKTLELQRIHISSDFDLYTTSVAGVGFDCGFRNAAMMVSCLLRDREISSVLAMSGIRDVPVIMEMQTRIEEAWNRYGFDPAGAAHSGFRLVGNESWIGACEIVVLLRSLGLRAHAEDFELSSEEAKTDMLRWVFDYFEQRCRRPMAGPRFQGCLRCRNPMFGRRGTLIPPLFLQHQGHSRTVVGVELTKKNELRMLVVDPARSFAVEFSRCTREHRSPLPLIRVGTSGLDKPRYQIAFVPENPIIANQEEFESLKSP